MPILKEVPEGLKDIGFVMSNYDHKIRRDAEKKLRAGGTYGGYGAMYFFGRAWFEDGLFYCVIEQYKAHIETISAGSLK